jgi:hypothetical protein
VSATAEPAASNPIAATIAAIANELHPRITPSNKPIAEHP